MLFRFLWRLLWGKAPSGGYSLRGFWGQICHYNQYGEQIGYTIKDFWGRRKRYDMQGNLISYTLRNFWGGYNTYDPYDNLIRKTYRNLLGGYVTYDRYGKKIVESYKMFWDSFNHFNVEEPGVSETFTLAEPKTMKHTAKTPKVQSSTKKLQHSVSEKKVTINNTTNKGPVKNISKEKELKIETKEAPKEVAAKRAQPLNTEYLSQVKIEAAVPYYESVDEYVKEQGKEQPCAKVLAFSLGKLKGVPACVYDMDTKFMIVPLVKGERSVTFDKVEIEQAKREIISDMGMAKIEEEFDSFGISKLSQEYEELFPEYEYTSDGIARTQYVLDCGLVITENSWIVLNELIKHE